MYSKKVLDIFKQPKNVGLIKNASGTGQVGNMKCGDIMKIYLKIEDEKVIDAKFKTFGCVAAIVSTDIACDKIKGKTIEEALQISNEDILKEMGEVPTNKIHCSILAKEAIEEAVKDYRKKQEKLEKLENKNN
ncbi:MAG: iron-sulfur cluster assembly scaffold protein [Clostridiales bacterium]|nr:iron-sulfur cluster assembly scaffold protein [Clostridiales bacterium]